MSPCSPGGTCLFRYLMSSRVYFLRQIHGQFRDFEFSQLSRVLAPGRLADVMSPGQTRLKAVIPFVVVAQANSPDLHSCQVSPNCPLQNDFLFQRERLGTVNNYRLSAYGRGVLSWHRHYYQFLPKVALHMSSGC